MADPKRTRSVVNFSIHPDVKESFQQACKEEGKSMSSIIERLMKLYVDTLRLTPDAAADWGHWRSPKK